MLVVSALYQIDLLNKPLTEVIREVRDNVSEDPESLYYLCSRERAEALDFFEELLRGTTEHRAELDQKIEDKLQNWTLSRVGTLERAILRLGCFELLHRDDIPAKVSLNEMVELSKSFCDVKSKDFINGVLDALAP